mmetsp:Transcript_20324/g.24331  ORF Transcript_20324/g.24331 Transcript_20324/m.24331 type:complete len:132 (+) Transcript_20324:635-1030(+)
MAFPCDQFGSQAPCSSDCERAYIYHKMNVPDETFPVFDKLLVNGPGTSDIYAYLKESTTTDDCGGCEVPWNYQKYLVNSTGNGVKKYPPGASPLEAENDIRALLDLPPLGVFGIEGVIKDENTWKLRNSIH